MATSAVGEELEMTKELDCHACHQLGKSLSSLWEGC